MSQARLATLVERHLDGSLSDPEAAELRDLLEGSRDALEFYLESVDQHVDLADRFAPAARRLGESTRTHLRKVEPARPSRLPPAWLVGAACLLLGSLVAFVAWPKPRPAPVESVASDAPRPSFVPIEVPPVRTPAAPKPERPAEPVAKVPPAPAPEPPPRPLEPSADPLPPPPPAPASAPAAPALPPPPRVGLTGIPVAALEDFQGTVRVLAGASAAPAVRGEKLVPGHGLQTSGPSSWAVVVFLDGTRLELGKDSHIRLGNPRPGKSVVVEQGLVSAEVVRQPPRQPMFVRTSHLEVEVLGTRLSVMASAEGTCVGVKEGRVKATRLADLASAEMGAGQYVTAGGGAEWKVKQVAGVPRQGLLLWLRMDETEGRKANDSSGGSHTGTLFGNGKWSAAGQRGGALNVVYGSYLKVNDAQTLRPSSQLAVAAWVKVRKVDQMGSDVVSLAGSYGLRILPAGNVEFYLFRGTTWAKYITTGVNLVDGAWHHVVVQKGAESLEIHIDGSAWGRMKYADRITYYPPDFERGLFVGRQPLPGYYFDGWIDDVCVFDRPLTPEELGALAVLGR